MGSSSSTLAKTHVVVVGGSFGGTAAGKELEKLGFQVTVLEPKDCQYINFAATRAATQPGFEVQTMVPLDRVFKKPTSRFVRGFATGVDTVKKTVSYTPIGADGKPATTTASLSYDYLVLATGSNYSAPLKFEGYTSADNTAHVKKVQAAVAAATSVLVVGGGATGVELAGEVKTMHPTKPVTLVHSGPTLLSSKRGRPDTFKPAFFERMLAHVQARGISVLLNSRVDLDAVTSGATKVTGGVFSFASPTAVKAGAATVNADLVLLANGPTVNSAWLAGSTLAAARQQDGTVAVDGAYRVQGSNSTVFAVGDIAGSKDAKSGWVIAGQAGVVAANIKKLVLAAAQGRDAASVPLKQGKAGGTAGIILVAVGTGGVAMTPIGIKEEGAQSRSAIVRFKSKDLFTSMSAKQLGYSVAQVRAANGAK